MGWAGRGRGWHAGGPSKLRWTRPSWSRWSSNKYGKGWGTGPLAKGKGTGKSSWRKSTRKGGSKGKGGKGARRPLASKDFLDLQLEKYMGAGAVCK